MQVDFKAKEVVQDEARSVIPMNVYAVYDTVTDQYGNLFEAQNHMAAARSVKLMRLRSYQDFELHWIGQWDRAKGILITARAHGESVRKVEWIDPQFEKEMKASQGVLI